MKKIGREVLFLPVKPGNPRNGEGAFLRLNDGRIMHFYTKYDGNRWDDHCLADIVAIFSNDEGETWGNERVIVSKAGKYGNNMCPAPVRMANGNIGLVFCSHDTIDGCIPQFMYSEDDGSTWSEPVVIPGNTEEYYVLENQHTIVLSTGRVLIPANRHEFVTKPDGTKTISYHGKMLFFASDDNGRTWSTLSEEYDIPNPEMSATGLQETMVYERLDGSLRAFSRTDMLCQYESTSTDGGKTWSTPKPNKFFSSPDAPMLMGRAGNKLVAVFNPIPKYTSRGIGANSGHASDNWGRTPFIIAVSEDDGKTFPRIYYLEDDLTNGYCYPAIFDGGNYILVSYYHSDGAGVPLQAEKMVKIDYSELS